MTLIYPLRFKHSGQKSGQFEPFQGPLSSKLPLIPVLTKSTRLSCSTDKSAKSYACQKNVYTNTQNWNNLTIESGQTPKLDRLKLPKQTNLKSKYSIKDMYTITAPSFAYDLAISFQEVDSKISQQGVAFKMGMSNQVDRYLHIPYQNNLVSLSHCKGRILNQSET